MSCRFAIDPIRMTIIPLNSSVNITNIGSQAVLSPNDVLYLNKAYSCAGRVSTYGGGIQKVGVSKKCLYFLASFGFLLFVLRLGNSSCKAVLPIKLTMEHANVVHIKIPCKPVRFGVDILYGEFIFIWQKAFCT